MAINTNSDLLEIASKRKRYGWYTLAIGSTLYGGYLLVKNFEIVKKEDFYGKWSFNGFRKESWKKAISS